MPIDKMNRRGEADVAVPVGPTSSENDIVHLPRGECQSAEISLVLRRVFSFFILKTPLDNFINGMLKFNNYSREDGIGCDVSNNPNDKVGLQATGLPAPNVRRLSNDGTKYVPCPRWNF